MGVVDIATATIENNKPFTQYLRVGNGSIDLNEWKDGRNTARFKVASKLRKFSSTAEEPEPSKDFQLFQDYGQFEIYPTDVPALISLCSFLRDDMELTVKFNARRVA